jgi:molybdopterin molybdotransferase
VPLPSSADQPAAIDAALSAALEADAVVTSAGVCTGDHDHVCATLRRRGAFVAGCLRLRPARHVGLGEVEGRPVFALPGNPAASLLAFELLVRPAILRMGGHCSWRRPQVRATLGEAIQHAPGLTHVFWVRLEATKVGYRCVLSGPQGAGMLGSAAAADGLLVVPESSPGYAVGDMVSVQLLTGVALPACNSSVFARSPYFSVG